ncbi:MAG TPA: metalloregulator ArsR/SmtB family transcription factor [Candidatus Saccharimonadales bacterium]|nr:metalloregulator ArsR/SmtB family transcription factor [Candidatus Saccharimonadales bacterium]
MNLNLFSALAEPSRFQIVELLRAKPRPVGELADTLHIRQPQVSKHLKVLADAGIVEVRPQANQRIYELSPKKFQEIDNWLNKYRKLWEKRLDVLEDVLKREKAKLKKK